MSKHAATKKQEKAQHPASFIRASDSFCGCFENFWKGAGVGVKDIARHPGYQENGGEVFFFSVFFCALSDK